MRCHNLLFIPAICVLAALSSCGKKKNSDSAPVVPVINNKVKTVDNELTAVLTHYRIVYDAKTNVDSMIITVVSGKDTMTGPQVKFNYSGDSLCRIDQYSGTAGAYTTAVSYNADGAPTQITDMFLTQYFTYNNRELTMYKVVGHVGGPDPGYFTCKWSDGDMVFRIPPNSSDTEKYIYDTTRMLNRDYQPMPDDYLWNGRQGYSTRHLLTSIKGGTSETDYFYNFDAKGRLIKKRTVAGASRDTSTSIYGY